MTTNNAEFLDMFDDFVEEMREKVLHKYSENENIMLTQTLIDQLRLEQEEILLSLEDGEETDV